MSPRTARQHGRARRLLVPFMIVAAAVGLTGASSQADGDHNRLDLTSMAIPTQADPTVRDTAVDVERLRGPWSAAQTAATATSDCAGCQARATTLAVVYVDRGKAVHLDNVAAAWGSCVGCSATALSVQVVIVRRAQDVVANNRALAVNAACEGCHAAAAAHQLVVLEPRGKRLSRSDVDELRQWVADQADALSQPAPQARLRGLAPQVAPLAGLEARLGSSLGAMTTLERSSDVQTG